MSRSSGDRHRRFRVRARVAHAETRTRTESNIGAMRRLMQGWSPGPLEHYTRPDLWQARRPKHLFFTMDLEFKCTSADDFTQLVVGFSLDQLRNASIMARLRPGENIAALYPDLVKLYEQALANPGTLVTYTGETTSDRKWYLIAADGHRIDVPSATFCYRIDGSTREIDGWLELTDKELWRVRLLDPRQFTDPFERTVQHGMWLAARASELRELEDLRTALEARAKRHGRARKWDDPIKLRHCLREIHVEAFNNQEDWERIPQPAYCERLERKGDEKITVNTLKERFRDNGWLKNASLQDALREMAYDDTADQSS